MTIGARTVRRNPASAATIARYKGFRDGEGRFVPFTLSDEIQRRGHSEGARILLRLDVASGSELHGSFHKRPAR